MTYVGDRHLPIGIFQGSESEAPFQNAFAPGVGGGGMFGGDNVAPISQPVQNPWQNQGQSSALQSFLQQLMNVLQNFLATLGMGNLAAPGSSGATGPGEFYQNATASSVGDPHLTFNGTDALGQAHHYHRNSMRGHRNLLHSDSFQGGYRIATQTTQPGANGVTYNQSVAIATRGGATQVSLDRSGAATILQNGETTALGDGQSVDLGGGESVRRDRNGTVYVDDSNGSGGSISTVLSDNGNGVDVNLSATDVELDGALAR